MAKFISGNILKCLGNPKYDIFLFQSCGQIIEGEHKEGHAIREQILRMIDNPVSEAIMVHAPGIDKMLGAILYNVSVVRRAKLQEQPGVFNLAHVKWAETGQFLGAFQTRRMLADPDDRVLLSESVSSLAHLSINYVAHNKKFLQVALEYPNSDNVGDKDLIQILGQLPDNITIWRPKQNATDKQARSNP